MYRLFRQSVRYESPDFSFKMLYEQRSRRNALTEFSSLPNQISHKDLNSLLVSALKEGDVLKNESSEVSGKQEEWNSLLIEWTNISQVLVETIRQRESSVVEALKPHQAMALGALEVHLSMALQARLVLDKDKDSPA